MKKTKKKNQTLSSKEIQSQALLGELEMQLRRNDRLFNVFRRMFAKTLVFIGGMTLFLGGVLVYAGNLGAIDVHVEFSKGLANSTGIDEWDVFGNGIAYKPTARSARSVPLNRPQGVNGARNFRRN